jgi:hypothetical protein
MDKTRPDYNPAMWEIQCRYSIDDGEFEFSGRSVQDAEKILSPVVKALDQYLSERERRITFHFKMTFFNTETTRIFLAIFEKLKRYQASPENEVIVNWYYGDDDGEMADAGREFSEVIGIPFVFLERGENQIQA